MPYLMFELITKSYIRVFHPLKIEISTMIFSSSRRCLSVVSMTAYRYLSDNFLFFVILYKKKTATSSGFPYNI